MDLTPDTNVGILLEMLSTEPELNLISSNLNVSIVDTIDLYYQNRPLNRNSTLSANGIQSDDVVEIRRRIPSNPLTNPNAAVNPNLASALTEALAAAIRQQPQGQANPTNPSQRPAQPHAANPNMASLAALTADPFSAEAQALIEEQIRQQNIQSNMEMALEYNPETFARVTMLYVPMTVNNVPLQAFVDSGAQSTIMSWKCAQRCNIHHLVDKRFAGIAKGVGTAKIMGRVHSVQVKIGKSFFVCSFTIIDQDGMELLFGLDQLKRHQASIDLKQNALIIQDEVVPFLPEHMLPATARGEFEEEGSSTPPTNSSSSASTSSSTSTGYSSPPPPAVKSGTNGGSSSSTSAASASSSSPQRDAAPTSTGGGSNIAVSEAKIKTLTELGFTRHEAIGALQQTGGNEELAASLLFGSGFQ